MDTLDGIYWRILESGIIAIRNATLTGDLARCKAEAEHIHNIPSLIGEQNVNRHLFYVTVERNCYLEWVLSTNSDDLRQFVSLVYLPQWKRMDEVLGLQGTDQAVRWE